MDRPAIPVVAARATFAPTPSGSIANPPSKSALKGRSTAAAMEVRCASASSTDTLWSRRPVDHANPALVVASAWKPRLASARALPTSQGVGITKQPDPWSSCNPPMRRATADMRKRPTSRSALRHESDRHVAVCVEVLTRRVAQGRGGDLVVERAHVEHLSHVLIEFVLEQDAIQQVRVTRDVRFKISDESR